LNEVVTYITPLTTMGEVSTISFDVGLEDPPMQAADVGGAICAVC
jgi:hypothetical protein